MAGRHMVTEHVVDLAKQRYGDLVYEGTAYVVSGAAEEQAKAERQHVALACLRRRVRDGTGVPGVTLSLADLADLLVVLGLDEQ